MLCVNPLDPLNFGSWLINLRSIFAIASSWNKFLLRNKKLDDIFYIYCLTFMSNSPTLNTLANIKNDLNLYTTQHVRKKVFFQWIFFFWKQRYYVKWRCLSKPFVILNFIGWIWDCFISVFCYSLYIFVFIY